MEKGFDKPLASFDSEKDACGYANDLAKTRLVSKVVIEGRKLVGRLSLPAQAKRRLEAAQHKADLLAAASRPAIAKARETAAAADDYVHESP